MFTIKYLSFSRFSQLSCVFVDMVNSLVLSIELCVRCLGPQVGRTLVLDTKIDRWVIKHSAGDYKTGKVSSKVVIGESGYIREKQL